VDTTLGSGVGSGRTVTIASLNLHCGFSAAGQPFDVAAAVAGLDADIIAVQEAWWTTDDPGTDAPDAAGPDSVSPATAGPGPASQAAAGRGAASPATASAGAASPATASAGPAELAAAAADRGADPVAAAARELGARLIRTRLSAGASLSELSIAPGEEPGNWGIAVLTRLPVTSHETISLGQAPDELVSRAALICSVIAPGGWPLRLVCTHLSPRLSSPAQLYRLTQYLARTPVPTIIAGDLNMPRLATWVAGGYVPAVRGRTFPADWPLVQLDHLLANPGLTCLAAAVLPPVGSDHLPVRARFSVAPGARRTGSRSLTR
jgi:endonuclease/exonuclease/phosphatase family metal-dependent hydrolase